MDVAEQIESTPDYWLIVLMRAIRCSDLDLAGEAQTRLRELGVKITFADLLKEGADHG